jgi:tripeptidyl-peptidase-1
MYLYISIYICIHIYIISYGEDESYITSAEKDSFSNQAIKLGVRGVTIMVSAGDDGALSASARGDSSYCGYAPSFPASNPYVVAVGATQGPESTVPLPEVTCQSDLGGIITSGGGFSTYYSQPSYQTDVVTGYFNTVKGA